MGRRRIIRGRKSRVSGSIVHRIHVRNGLAVAYYFAKNFQKSLELQSELSDVTGEELLHAGQAGNLWNRRHFLKPYLDKYDKAVKGQDIEEYIKSERRLY